MIFSSTQNKSTRRILLSSELVQFLHPLKILLMFLLPSCGEEKFLIPTSPTHKKQRGHSVGIVSLFSHIPPMES
jgi:hypothetical protein